MTTDVRPRAAALADVLGVIAFFVAGQIAFRFVSAGIALRALLPTIATVAVATWLLRGRGLRWRDLGWQRPHDGGRAVAWALGLFVVDLFVVAPLASALANAFGWPVANLLALAGLRGNLALYLAFLIPISWGSAAIGEELIFRAFLLRRLGDALGGSDGAQRAAVLGQAVLFGVAHAYLGPRGMLSAGLLGLAAGLAYRWNGRNLWPVMIAHGLVDTVGVTALYLGIQHG